MGARRILILLLALATAGGTALFARSWLEGQQSNLAAAAAPAPVDEAGVDVLVADVSLPAGAFVQAQHLRWQRWPSDDVPEIYVVRGSRSEDEFIGAVVRRGVVPGQPVIDAMLVKPGERGFLAAVLEPGMRAVSVPINATSGNSGLIFPGDRVDLILTQTIAPPEEGPVRRVSETVLEDIRVIAMGDTTSDETGEGKSHDNARTATLEVTPRQAETVTLVTELGKLSLSLRALARGDGAAGPVVAPRYTWDSDISEVLRSGASLTVLRGSESESVSLEQGASE